MYRNGKEKACSVVPGESTTEAYVSLRLMIIAIIEYIISYKNH